MDFSDLHRMTTASKMFPVPEEDYLNLQGKTGDVYQLIYLPQNPLRMIRNILCWQFWHCRSSERKAVDCLSCFLFEMLEQVEILFLLCLNEFCSCLTVTGVLINM